MTNVRLSFRGDSPLLNGGSGMYCHPCSAASPTPPLLEGGGGYDRPPLPAPSPPPSPAASKDEGVAPVVGALLVALVMRPPAARRRVGRMIGDDDHVAGFVREDALHLRRAVAALH